MREKLRNDRARAEQIQKNIEAFEKKNNSSIQKKAAKHKGLQELNETNANPLNDNPNSNSSTETKSNKDDNFDEMINKVNEAFVKPAAPLVPNEWRTPEIEIIINECIISNNDYDGLRKCLIKDIKDQKILAPLLEKIQEIETENNKFSRQHLSGLKLALNNSNNRTFLIASCAICEKRKKKWSKKTTTKMLQMQVSLELLIQKKMKQKMQHSQTIVLNLNCPIASLIK